MAASGKATYIDQLIADGENATLSLKNFYDTMLINTNGHYFRVPWEDFFTKHFEDLAGLVQYYTIPQTMFYKPKTLSLELYGTTELWVAILRLNKMRNITEFHRPIILIWEPNRMNELINVFFKREGNM